MINPLAKTGGSGSASSAPQMTNRCWCRWGICCAITQPSSKWRSGCTLASSAMYSRCGHTCPQTSRTKHARASVNTSAASSLTWAATCWTRCCGSSAGRRKSRRSSEMMEVPLNLSKTTRSPCMNLKRRWRSSLSPLWNRARWHAALKSTAPKAVPSSLNRLSRGSKFGFVWRRRRVAMPKANRLSK